MCWSYSLADPILVDNAYFIFLLVKECDAYADREVVWYFCGFPFDQFCLLVTCQNMIYGWCTLTFFPGLDSGVFYVRWLEGYVQIELGGDEWHIHCFHVEVTSYH